MEESLTRFWYPVRFRASSTRCEYAPGASGGGRSRLWRSPQGGDASQPRVGRGLRAPAPAEKCHAPRPVAGCFGRGALTLVAVAEGEVRLEAEDGPDLARPGLGVELPRPVQVAVVGDRERVHAQRLDPVEQFGDPVGAVEEGVLAVGVEVNERHTASGRYRRSSALSKAHGD